MDKWKRLNNYIEHKIQYPGTLDVNTLNAVLNAMGNYQMNEEIAGTLEAVAKPTIEENKPFLTVNRFQAKMPNYLKELQLTCRHDNTDHVNDEHMIELFCLDCGLKLFTHIKED